MYLEISVFVLLYDFFYRHAHAIDMGNWYIALVSDSQPSTEKHAHVFTMIIHGISIKNQREGEKAGEIHLAVTSCIDCIIVTYVFTIRDVFTHRFHSMMKEDHLYTERRKTISSRRNLSL